MQSTSRADSVEHWVHFSAAFDRRDPDPSKNYGIHGVDMRWYIRGELGAVQFVVFTNWQLPHVTEEGLQDFSRDTLDIKCRYLPVPADLGYHSYVPHYDSQDQQPECHLLKGPCYYDGSGLNAKPVFDLLVAQGSDAVWDYLFNYYREVFGELR